MKKNNIVLVGTVIEEIRSDLIYKGELMYSTFLQVNRIDGRFDRAMIIASKEQFDACDAKFGSRLYIEGEVETRNEYNLEGKRKVVVYVKAIKMCKALHKRDANYVEMVGCVCDKPTIWKVANGWNRANFMLAVQNSEEGIISFVPCVAWRKNCKKVQTFNAGDRIVIAGWFNSRFYNKYHENGEKERAIAYEIEIGKII